MKRHGILLVRSFNGPGHDVFGCLTVEIGNAIAGVLPDQSRGHVIVEGMCRAVGNRTDAAERWYKLFEHACVQILERDWAVRRVKLHASRSPRREGNRPEARSTDPVAN